jgi:hypothetical protein
MNLREPRRTTVTLPDYGDVTIKHLTTKEYHNFQQMEDKLEGLKYAVKVSLGIEDEAYDDIPMSLLKPLATAIMEANGLTVEQEAEQVKN